MSRCFVKTDPTFLAVDKSAWVTARSRAGREAADAVVAVVAAAFGQPAAGTSPVW
ncbi:hypothetical protein GCM10027615_61270 [Plantactinospora veratri]